MRMYAFTIVSPDLRRRRRPRPSSTEDPSPSRATRRPCRPPCPRRASPSRPALRRPRPPSRWRASPCRATRRRYRPPCPRRASPSRRGRRRRPSPCPGSSARRSSVLPDASGPAIVRATPGGRKPAGQRHCGKPADRPEDTWSFVAGPREVCETRAMAKVAIIGAGSVEFTRSILADLCSYEELHGSLRVALHDIDPERLAYAERAARQVVDRTHAGYDVSAHADRRPAFDGADYLINEIQVGGYRATVTDFEV